MIGSEAVALDYETACSMCGKTLDVEDAVCDNCGASAIQVVVL